MERYCKGEGCHYCREGQAHHRIGACRFVIQLINRQTVTDASHVAEWEARYELNAEIERSKTLASKNARTQPPGSATRGRVRGGGIFGTDDPKNAAVIQFYEDLTNLLVPNLKFEPGKYLGLEESSFTCIYTYMDLNKMQGGDGEGASEKSKF